MELRTKTRMRVSDHITNLEQENPELWYEDEGHGQ